jgi:oxygen-independent coproporphyrinogen-3 oxidase
VRETQGARAAAFAAALPPDGITASLYLHIPFCAQKCAYCDFYSRPLRGDWARLDRYLDRLYHAVRRQLDLFRVRRTPSVYIGGGTPSLLGARRVAALLSFLKKTLPSSPAEITVEANPESLDEAFLGACAEGGVHRLSIGVQSFHDPSRESCSRGGSAALVREKLCLAAESGLPLALDLISGLPFQDERALCADIAAALSYRPVHLSLYDLCVEEGTPLAARVAAGETALPSAEEAEELWLLGSSLLKEAGYEHYEVSNFAKNGAYSRHNLRYWRMENWLGAGKSASGTIINDETGEGLRVTGGVFTRLNRADLIKESIMMGFRTIFGPPAALFRSRFGANIDSFIPQTLRRWRSRGLLHGGALDAQGLLLLNRFLKDAFSELDGAG